MKKGWVTKRFEDCIELVKYTSKIQQKDFLDDGQFPIVSQEAEFTNGYWNDEADVFRVSTPVVILDEAFESIATAKANAEINLQNARAICESHLQSVFTQRGEGYSEKKLSDVCAITSNLVEPRASL